MKYTFPVNPPYRISQKYGQNALNYDKLGIPGLLKHDGVDIAVPTGTPLFYPHDGIITAFENKVPANQHTGGYGNFLRFLVVDDGKNYDWILGHMLPGFKAKVGMFVEQGDLLANVDNTGFSTGPHTHLGVRKIVLGHGGPAGRSYLGKHYSIPDYNNGALGYIDPMPFFDNVKDEVYSVDMRYNQNRTWAGYLREKRAVGQFTRKMNRLPTEREINGLAYGYWDVETILDEVMFPVWSNMHKPEYNKRYGKK